MLTYEEESDLSPWEFTAHQTKLGSQAAVTCFYKGQESYRVSLSNLAAQNDSLVPMPFGTQEHLADSENTTLARAFSYVIQSCIRGNKRLWCGRPWEWQSAEQEMKIRIRMNNVSQQELGFKLYLIQWKNWPYMVTITLMNWALMLMFISWMLNCRRQKSINWLFCQVWLSIFYFSLFWGRFWEG